MTEQEFKDLKVFDLIDVDFKFSNITIKGRGVVTQKYPTSAYWMDLEAVVVEANGDRRTGALPLESCTVVPKAEAPSATLVSSNSDNCVAAIIGALRTYGKI